MDKRDFEKFNTINTVLKSVLHSKEKGYILLHYFYQENYLLQIHIDYRKGKDKGLTLISECYYHDEEMKIEVENLVRNVENFVLSQNDVRLLNLLMSDFYTYMNRIEYSAIPITTFKNFTPLELNVLSLYARNFNFSEIVDITGMSSKGINNTMQRIRMKYKNGNELC